MEGEPVCAGTPLPDLPATSGILRPDCRRRQHPGDPPHRAPAPQPARARLLRGYRRLRLAPIGTCNEQCSRHAVGSRSFCGSRPARFPPPPRAVASVFDDAAGRLAGGFRPCIGGGSPPLSRPDRSLAGVAPAQPVDDGTVGPVVAAARLDEMGKFVVQRLQFALLGRDLPEPSFRDPLHVGT